MQAKPQDLTGFPSRWASASWADSAGNLWLFGGCEFIGCSIVGNDLWTYSQATATWTHVSGGNTEQGTGAVVYGSKGVAAPANIPGARASPASWIDKSGNLWMFGGTGFDGAANRGFLNDLWTYNPGTGQWTWVSGSNASNAQANYGTQGVPAVANVPGARSGTTSWIDASGNLWLFGGIGLNAAYLNDLWMYSPTTGLWTWVGGSSAPNAVGQYGALGVPAAANVPGARNGAAAWTDASSNLWLFGGSGYDGAATLGLMNDMWMYSPGTGLWTWVSGASTAYATAQYGMLGISASTSVPAARGWANSWSDADGNLWLLGGVAGANGSHRLEISDDLWKFSPSTNLWTWMGALEAAGVGAEADAWSDNSGHVWLLGGFVFKNTTPYPAGNGFWEYSP